MDCLAASHLAPRDLRQVGADRGFRNDLERPAVGSDQRRLRRSGRASHVEARREWTNDKFDPAVESTPRAKRKIAEHVVRGKGGSTLKRKRFTGGSIVITGANSRRACTKSRSSSCCGDDLDISRRRSVTRVIRSHGPRAPDQLHKDRRKTRKLDVSTPTNKATSRIWKQYEAGHRARYQCLALSAAMSSRCSGAARSLNSGSSSRSRYRTAHITFCEAAGCIIETAARRHAGKGRWSMPAPSLAASQLSPERALFAVHELGRRGKDFLEKKDEFRAAKDVVTIWLGEPWTQRPFASMSSSCQFLDDAAGRLANVMCAVRYLDLELDPEFTSGPPHCSDCSWPH